jgi:hypothetical protein
MSGSYSDLYLGELSHLGIDMPDWRMQPPFAFRKRRIRRDDELVATITDVHEELVQGLPEYVAGKPKALP